MSSLSTQKSDIGYFLLNLMFAAANRCSIVAQPLTNSHSAKFGVSLLTNKPAGGSTDWLSANCYLCYVLAGSQDPAYHLTTCTMDWCPFHSKFQLHLCLCCLLWSSAKWVLVAFPSCGYVFQGQLETQRWHTKTTVSRKLNPRLRHLHKIARIYYYWYYMISALTSKGICK